MSKLINKVGELLEKTGLGISALAEIYGLNARHLSKIGKGEARSINLDELRVLLSIGKTHGLDPFVVETDPVLETFDQDTKATPLQIIRGKENTLDAEVEVLLRKFLKSSMPSTRVVTTTEIGEEQLWGLMQTHNCLVLGGPWRNPAAEYVVASLWGAEPFKATQANRRKLPFLVYGKHPQQASTTMIDKSGKHGVETNPLTKTAQFFESTFIPDWEEYVAWGGEGTGTGILVHCRKPLGTTRDVTTVALIGASDLATAVLAQMLAASKVPLERSHIRSGIPTALVLSFKFKKVAKRDEKRPLANGREWTMVAK